MPTITPPAKPFPGYKWRWATFQPTESLNNPPVFLGVLRVFNRFTNHAPGSTEILDGLAVVQSETDSKVDLVRTPDRNLVRNSGQYWKALGLLEEAHGKVMISPFGQLLATGKITQVEFAITIIKTLELPNRRIIDDTSEWDRASLRIRPLELIIDILAKLQDKYGETEAYLSPFELVKIVIPLAGAKTPLHEYPEAIIQYRNGQLDISHWPDCAPSSNDVRMAREFLLFLVNYGFCNVVKIGRGKENEKYYLASISKEEAIELRRLRLIQPELDKVVKVIRETQIPANVERKRVSREVLERPNQSIFRKNILAAFNSTCIVTGVDVDTVLEASHIVPVKDKGTDFIENGLCLRSDIHQLFDSGHLRVLPSGELIFSEIAAKANNYGRLPRRIMVPHFTNRDNLDWRVKYC